MSHELIYRCLYYLSLNVALNVVVALLSMQGQKVLGFHRKKIKIFVLKMNPPKVAEARPSEGSFSEEHIFTFYFDEIRELSGRIINDRIFE